MTSPPPFTRVLTFQNFALGHGSVTSIYVFKPRSLKISMFQLLPKMLGFMARS